MIGCAERFGERTFTNRRLATYDRNIFAMPHPGLQKHAGFEALLSSVFVRLRSDRSGTHVTSFVDIHPYELMYSTRVYKNLDHVWQDDMHRVKLKHGNRHWTLCYDDNYWFADGNFAE